MPFLSEIPEMAQPIWHLSSHVNSILVISISIFYGQVRVACFENGLEDFVDVVGIATLHSDDKSLVVFLNLQHEGNLLDDLAFSLNQEV